MDRDLGSRNEVSMADVRHVLERKGLSCRAVFVPPDGLDELGVWLEAAPSRRAAIAAIPTSAPGKRHFALVVGADPHELSILDASAGGVFSLARGKFSKGGSLPVLIVGTTRDETDSLASGEPHFGAAVARLFSSRLLTIGVGLALAVIAAPLTATFATMALGRFYHTCTLPSRAAKRVCKLAWRHRAPVAALASGSIVAAVAICWRGSHEGTIVIEPQVIDLGRVPVGSQQAADCTVRNRGATSQKIGDIWRSCSCLNITMSEHEIPAGDETPLNVNFMVATRGETAQTIVLTPKDGAARPARLRITYDAFDAVRLAPVYFNVGEFPFGSSAERIVEFSVEDFEGEPAAFESIELTGEAHVLDAAFQGAPELRDGARFTVRLTSRADAPLCRFAQNFVLKTRGEAPRSFVVMAYGSVVPAVRVAPQAVVLLSPRWLMSPYY